jgi:hypothetical protein
MAGNNLVFVCFIKNDCCQEIKHSGSCAYAERQSAELVNMGI